MEHKYTGRGVNDIDVYPTKFGIPSNYALPRRSEGTREEKDSIDSS